MEHSVGKSTIKVSFYNIKRTLNLAYALKSAQLLRAPFLSPVVRWDFLMIFHHCELPWRFFRCVAPFFDNGLRNPAWICPPSDADFFGDVHAFLSGFQEGHQFCHLFTFLLGLQSTGLFRHFLNNLQKYTDADLTFKSLLFLTHRFCFIKTLFGSRFYWTSRRSAKLEGSFLTVGFRSVFLNGGSFQSTFGDWPFGAFFSSGIALGFTLAFFFVNLLALGTIFFHFVLVISKIIYSNLQS